MAKYPTGFNYVWRSRSRPDRIGHICRILGAKIPYGMLMKVEFKDGEIVTANRQSYERHRKSNK
jgi:hypothetical protein